MCKEWNLILAESNFLEMIRAVNGSRIGKQMIQCKLS